MERKRGMESFVTMDSSENTVATTAYTCAVGGGHRRHNKKGKKYVKDLYVMYGEDVTSAHVGWRYLF